MYKLIGELCGIFKHPNTRIMKNIFTTIIIISTLTIKSQSMVSLFTQGFSPIKSVQKDIERGIRKGKKIMLLHLTQKIK